MLNRNEIIGQFAYVVASCAYALAKIGQWQGEQARYIGLRKNLFDLRRMAVVHNLHVLAQMLLVNPIEATA